MFSFATKTSLIFYCFLLLGFLALTPLQSYAKPEKLPKISLKCAPFQTPYRTFLISKIKPPAYVFSDKCYLQNFFTSINNQNIGEEILRRSILIDIIKRSIPLRSSKIDITVTKLAINSINGKAYKQPLYAVFVSGATTEQFNILRGAFQLTFGYNKLGIPLIEQNDGSEIEFNSNSNPL